jgi:hypothetical protein
MYYDLNRNIIVTRRVIVLFFLIFSVTAASSEGFQQDTVLRVAKGSVIRINDIKTFVVSDTIIHIPASLSKADDRGSERIVIFYDSLKSKSSKSKFAKALFDLVIIMPDTLNTKKIINRSDKIFSEFSGMKIRKITIQRLDVFGADVDNPGKYTSKSTERLLNATHMNTSERIIQKNLLFSEGDTVSPLTLSDNERILRQLPFIDDARIIVIPVAPGEAEIIVITKDVYSLGGDFTYRGISKGSVWLFDKNIFGRGHELKIEIPYSGSNPDSPGIGVGYNVNNISRSFINLNLNYYNALGKRTYGFTFQRDLISSETKYGGGITIRQMYTTEDLDTLPVPEPLHYNYQDYWLLRSFMVDRSTVSRIITGIRFINDNIFKRPFIDPESYYALQKKSLLLGSVAFSRQKYFKTNLLYSYGRTEDIPYGSLIRLTGGLEKNEFKNRFYVAPEASFGTSFANLGYISFYGGFGIFIGEGKPEQGVLSLKTLYYSNLLNLGKQKIRNFLTIDYSRGYNRYTDEYLNIPGVNGFTGFRNDSIRGGQRIRLGLESVIFNPVNFYGFRFAFFGFANFAFLAGTNQIISNGSTVTGFGLGIRIRNDNLVFKTFQVRIGYYPAPPEYSDFKYLIFSGEQLLRPRNFDPGPPALIPYR